MEAREKIDAAVALAEANDPSKLRPVAKELLNGPLRKCLTNALANKKVADHARNAMEYIATVVEFDALDKLSKDHQPKASKIYTKQKLDFSIKAYRAADNELASYIFLAAQN